MKIVTLTFSSAYDVHCDARKIIVGSENFVRLTEKNPGGKGINISRALASFGIKSTAVAVLGEENCAEYVRCLEKEGIDLKKILISGRIRENVTVHTEDGDETRISFVSDKIQDDIMPFVRDLTSELGAGDIVTVTGSIPEGVSILDVKNYIKELQSRKTRVIVDSRSFSLSDIREIKPYLIKPNKCEAEAYLGRRIFTNEDAYRAALDLKELGAENVMLTLGGEGAVLATADVCYFARAPRLNAASTIGAGDSSIAGFIYAVLLGCGEKDALLYSMAFGSAACLKSGTNPPDKADVERILKEIVPYSFN